MSDRGCGRHQTVGSEPDTLSNQCRSGKRFLLAISARNEQYIYMVWLSIFQKSLILFHSYICFAWLVSQYCNAGLH